MSATTSYIIVSAPGHYGDSSRVISAHRSLAAARRRAADIGPSVCVRSSGRCKGDRWLHAYEQGDSILFQAGVRA